MAGSRMSSFLPTVKCSMCAQDIEISMMGDHICGGAPEPTPPLDSHNGFSEPQYKQQPPRNSNLLKPGRIQLPRVDTGAANRPYFRNDQLTPVSASSESRNPSPLTPNYDGRKSPFFGPPRAAKGAFRRPPSPEILSSNLDSAFPPFPQPKSPKRHTKYGGRNDRPEQGQRFGAADSRYAPMSPRDPGVGGLLQKMNSITPGPFDVNGRRGPPVRGRSEDRVPPLREGDEIKRPATSNEDRIHVPEALTLNFGHSRSGTKDFNKEVHTILDIPPVPKLERMDGYGGFATPIVQEDQQPKGPLRPEDRSQTYPLKTSGNEFGLPRRPSEPGVGQRRPSISAFTTSPESLLRTSPPRHGRQPSMANLDRTKAPPRGVSVIARKDSQAHNANLNLAAEFGAGNPYHTPTVSQSSSGSNQSADSKTSSRSSPPGSNQPSEPRRKDSDTLESDALEILMSDIQLKIAEGPEVTPTPKIEEQFARAMSPPRTLQPSLLSPESPMDPAIQGGRLSPIPPRSPMLPPALVPGALLATLPAALQPAQRPLAKRPTTGKGNCKGCGNPIKGKSVSSADGRLTGRYHKQCFVCTTCKEPFATTMFYVLNDSPYCERHYHKLNNSVCQTCDKGIEGEYLETESKQKYHPNCLTCADCRRVLREDYFEMNGRVYCERDAYRKAQQRTFLGPGAGGTNRMERRTTRLMMMI